MRYLDSMTLWSGVLLCVVWSVCSLVYADGCADAFCRTLYLPRSTHANSSYFLTYPRLGNGLHIVTSLVEAGYLYERSFRADDIATCLVRRPTITFAGSQVSTRTDDEYIADQFGLSPLYEGSVTFAPEIHNHSLHLQGIWHAPTDERGCGLFTRAQLSITHQSRSLFDMGSNFCTNRVIGPDFPPGAMGADTVPVAPDLQVALAGRRTYGDVIEPWFAGRCTMGNLSDTQLAGVTLDLGYAAIHHDVHAYSFFARMRPPTGTVINGFQDYAQSLFYPIIGEGHHWEFGAGASMSGEVWRDEAGRSIVFHAEGYVTHLFTNTQVRSFDLTGRGCLSRYMLLKAFDAATGAPRSELVPAINISTRPVDVSITALGEVAVQLIYQGSHGSFTVGYEWYGQDEEKLCLRDRSWTRHGTAYGLKGCQGDYYYAYTIDSGQTITGPADPFAVPLNGTSSLSTITTCSGADTPLLAGSTTVAGVAWNNPYTGTGSDADLVAPGTSAAAVTPAYRSAQPKLLGPADIDVASATAPQQIAHKGVLAFTYCWSDDDPAPYVSAGFTAEGSGAACSLKQWGVWIKGGVTF